MDRISSVVGHLHLERPSVWVVGDIFVEAIWWAVFEDSGCGLLVEGRHSAGLEKVLLQWFFLEVQPTGIVNDGVDLMSKISKPMRRLMNN